MRAALPLGGGVLLALRSLLYPIGPPPCGLPFLRLAFLPRAPLVRSVLVAVAIVDLVAGPCFFPSACVVKCIPLFLPFPFPILVLAWPAVLSAPRASLLLHPPSPSSCPPFPSPCSRLHVFPRPRRRWPALTRLSLLLRVSCYSNPSPPCRRRPPSFLCALGGPGLQVASTRCSIVEPVCRCAVLCAPVVSSGGPPFVYAPSVALRPFVVSSVLAPSIFPVCTGTARLGVLPTSST